MFTVSCLDVSLSPSLVRARALSLSINLPIVIGQPKFPFELVLASAPKLLCAAC